MGIGGVTQGPQAGSVTGWRVGWGRRLDGGLGGDVGVPLADSR